MLWDRWNTIAIDSVALNQLEDFVFSIELGIGKC